jgi:cellulose synthase/poly-beta-1,6-N-acetylglucosamine synthase-like glycosyltransferase
MKASSYFDQMPRVSVGMCAYNEEANVRRSLESITLQALRGFELIEIIVVSSASTDRTDDIVKEYSSLDGRVRLIIQKKREGKTSAVNLFMSKAAGDILVLVNADNTLTQGSLQSLLEPFNDSRVGVAGGHPIPVNSKETLIGFAINMLWEMHHQLSLSHPKVGELIAFRNVGVMIPAGTSTDEDAIRMNLEGRGYRTVYAPNALVMNKGPTTLSDFWKQRTRVNIGEQYMKRRFDYDTPTWNLGFIISAMKEVLKNNWKHPVKAFLSIGLEVLSRTYATIYVKLDRGDKSVWEMVQTSKDVK